MIAYIATEVDVCCPTVGVGVGLRNMFDWLSSAASETTLCNTAFSELGRMKCVIAFAVNVCLPLRCMEACV